MKKFIAVLLAAVMALTCVSVLAEEVTKPSQKEDLELGYPRPENPVTIDVDDIAEKKSNFTQSIFTAIPLNTAKYSPVACPKIIATSVSSKTTDEQLKMYKQMGINAVELSIGDDELTYEALQPIVKRLRNFEEGGFEILLASNYKFQKDTDIHLGYDTRDSEIARFCDYLRLLSSVGIDTCAIAWQPFGISRSKTTPHSIHGANAGASDMEEILNFPNKGERLYTREEMWDSFKYFLDAVLPVCEETGVRMALHPNDPPVPYLEGVGSLIISADDYRRAFDLANDSPYLGMKLCTGCWLEGGTLFSDDFLGDIDEFVRRGKVFEVHFRNVTAPLDSDYSGYFEECLAQDGYADMYEIMKQFIRSGYNGPMFCDHAARTVDPSLGSQTNMATSNAFIQGLIYAARNEVGKEIMGK